MKITHNDTKSILGELKTIIYSDTNATKPLVINDERIIKVYRSDLHSHSHNDILNNWLKEHFRNYANRKVAEISEKHGFEFNKIAIKDTKTRWGSCSSKKNLNFNWRLVFTPIRCIDYVIIHELAHTKQMNHSKDFWDIVEGIEPGFRGIKRELRGYEKELIQR